MVSWLPVGDGDLELGADAVSGGDQHRIAKPAALRSNSAPKPPRPAAVPGRARRLGQRLDRLDQGIAGIDVDAGVAVILALYGALDRYRLLPRRDPRHGDNTFDPERFAMLVKRSLAAALALALASLAATAAALAAAPRVDVFTVAPVPVDVTAANASTARDQAIAEATSAAGSCWWGASSSLPTAASCRGSASAAQRAGPRLRGGERAPLRRALHRRFHHPFPP